MAFLTPQELDAMGFASLGKDVRISSRAAIYNPELISIGDRSRIDDFCVVSGKVTIGKNVHLAVFCNIAGGREGVIFEDFSGCAYGCHVFSQSDDYTGRSLTNPTVPPEFKNETCKEVRIGRHCILGTGTMVFPGVTIGEGTATGAAAVVTKSTQEWSVYIGHPAKRVKSRRQDLLIKEKEYLATIG